MEKTIFPMTASDANGCKFDDSAVRPHLLLALSVVATVALYLPHLTNVFIDWDLVAYRDILYTTDYRNTAIRLFTDFQGKVVSGYYAPFASVSLMLDKWLINGTEPSAWFTLFLNLLIHCLNGILVFRVLRVVRVSPGVAAFAALIFLIHPLQTSSVLWFAQRKGLLATALYLLAYLAYLRYTDQGGRVAYLGALALFGIALVTKPTVVVLPVALLAWQVMVDLTKRSAQGGDGPAHARVAPLEGLGEHEPTATVFKSLEQLTRSAARNMVPLLPFFLLAVASGLAATQSETVSMEVETPPDLPIADRPFIAATAIGFYVGKALLPMGLTPIYPRWDVDIHHVVWWLPLLGLAGMFVLFVRYRDRIGQIPFWCILNFLVPLLPVIGLMKFGYLRLSYVADHFMYLPMAGMAGLMAVSLCAGLTRVGARARPALAALAVAYIAFLGLQTWLYAATWKDSVTFWSHSVAHNPQSWATNTYLGHALVTAGRPRDAAGYFQKTIALKQAYVADHRDRAHGLEGTGNTSEAKREQTKADNVAQTLAVAYHNLGNAFLFSNLHGQAVEQYKLAIQLQPNLVRALTNLGVCYIALGNFPDAVHHLTRATELGPNNFEAHYNLGYALRVLGDRGRAEKHFAKARSLRPDVPLPEFPDDQKAGTQGP